MLALVHAAKRLAEHGLDTRSVVVAVVGALLLTLFVVRQRRVAHPLVDVSLFTRPAFTAAVGGNIAVSFAAAGLGLLTFTFLQTVHGLSPLHAALWGLPTFVGTALGATLAGRVAHRVRPGATMAVGLLTGAGGFAVVGSVGVEAHLAVFIGGYTLVTFGVGVVATLANTLVLEAAPRERAGAAAGISETGAEFGAALGIAVLGTTAATVYRTTMERELPEVGGAAAETVTGALAAAPHAQDPAALLATAFAAYTDGIGVAALTGACLLAALAFLVAVVLRRVPAGATEPLRGREPESAE